MIRGLYTSAWSMLANQKVLDVITNNLANANTTAYKKDAVVWEGFQSVLTRRVNDLNNSSIDPLGNVGNMVLGSDIGQIYTYYTQGQLNNTGNDFNFAIANANNAFFTLGKPDDKGNVTDYYYTRNGSFTLNTNNQMVDTANGYLLIGSKGPIKLIGSEPIEVTNNGEIIQNGQSVGNMLITEFQDPTMLEKYGNNLFSNTNSSKTQAFSGIVQQGYLEESNVNIVREMVNMIEVMRAYEANQKMIQQQDNILGKAVNDVGAVK